MAIERATRARTARIGTVGCAKIADVEYRLVLNKATMEWNVFRNGAATDVSARKKKKSAMDSAIRDAKAELESSNAYIIVTCAEGREVETVCRGLQPTVVNRSPQTKTAAHCGRRLRCDKCRQ